MLSVASLLEIRLMIFRTSHRIGMTQLAFDILFFGRLWGAGWEKVRILKVTKSPHNILVTEASAISQHMAGKPFTKDMGSHYGRTD